MSLMWYWIVFQLREDKRWRDCSNTESFQNHISYMQGTKDAKIGYFYNDIIDYDALIHTFCYIAITVRLSAVHQSRVTGENLLCFILFRFRYSN